MSVSSYQFIDPSILSAIADLELIAKTVVDGFMLGVNQSPMLGVGLEFNQYRSYQPGDDPARIDWKMFARSDRYFVREAEVETSISVRFILDATASMAHQDHGLTKFDYARYLVASLGYLASSQGDAIGLHALTDAAIVNLPARRDHQNLHRFLHQLETLRPSGHWPGWQELERVFTETQQRAVIVFVSDMHERESEIQQAIRRLSARRNEVLLFHLLGKNEIDFDYQGFITFEDLETGETVEVDAEKLRANYLQTLESRIRSLRQAAHDHNVSYELLSTRQPLDYALRNYLTQRIRHG